MFGRGRSFVAVSVEELYFNIMSLYFQKSYYMEVLFKIENWNYSSFNVIGQVYLEDLKNKL